MKIYVAGKWEDRERVSLIMRMLENMRHQITCDWTDHKYENEAYSKQYCADDVQGVRDAELFIGIFVANYHYWGALVEMGIALGVDIPVWLLGNKADSCIFSNHPSVKKFKGLIELVNTLKELGQ